MRASILNRFIGLVSYPWKIGWAVCCHYYCERFELNWVDSLCIHQWKLMEVVGCCGYQEILVHSLWSKSLPTPTMHGSFSFGTLQNHLKIQRSFSYCSIFSHLAIFAGEPSRSSLWFFSGESIQTFKQLNLCQEYDTVILWQSWNAKEFCDSRANLQ